MKADDSNRPDTPARLSEMPGFIPWKPGQPIPDQLRRELNVTTFVRNLRRAVRQAAIEEKSV